MPGHRTAPDHRGKGKAGSYPLPWGCLAPRLGKPLVSVLSGAGGLVSSDGGRSNQSALPPRVTLFPWLAGGHGEGGSKSPRAMQVRHCQPCQIFIPAKLKIEAPELSPLYESCHNVSSQRDHSGGIFGGINSSDVFLYTYKTITYPLNSIETPGTIRFHDKRPSSRMAFCFSGRCAYSGRK